MQKTQFIYGVHTVSALLEVQPELILELFVISGRQDERIRVLLARASDSNITLNKISRADFIKHVGNQAVHQGIAAKCKYFNAYAENFLQIFLENSDQENLFLVLDEVQDPHNLGACLRSSNAFGVTAVVIPEDRACKLTPVVRKVACGAAEKTPLIAVKNLSRTLKYLQEQGLWIVGLAGESDTVLADIDLTGNIALVLGSEGQGLRRLTRKYCDYMVKIPMLGEVGSLNVSTATAVSLYEVVRQRQFVA